MNTERSTLSQSRQIGLFEVSGWREGFLQIELNILGLVDRMLAIVLNEEVQRDKCLSTNAK
jgi:hypothetical protein